MSRLNRRQEGTIVALDIKAAFDRAWHKGLLVKLVANGVRGQLLQWLSSYLMDRHIHVVVNGQTSKPTPINATVPQGSIIGPTLFLVYNNNLCDNLHNPPCLCADDGTIDCLLDEVNATISLSKDLQKIYGWGQKWNVRFATEKCKVMSLSRRLPSEHPPEFFMGGKLLQHVHELDILGVRFSRSLGFQFHVNSIAVRAGQRLSALRSIAPYLDRHG